MQVSLLLFGLAFLTGLVLFIRAVGSDGDLSIGEGILGILALVMSIAGFGIPLYGHFIVRAESRIDYRTGLILNGILMLIYFFFYFLGL